MEMTGFIFFTFFSFVNVAVVVVVAAFVVEINFVTEIVENNPSKLFLLLLLLRLW